MLCPVINCKVPTSNAVLLLVIDRMIGAAWVLAIIKICAIYLVEMDVDVG